MKCFNNSFQSTVNARRQRERERERERERDGNPSSSVVAETNKLLANSSFFDQDIDWSRHTLTKHLSCENTHIAFSTKIFKSLGYTNDQLDEMRLVNLEIERKETNIVEFVILQCAKLRLIELH